MSAEPLSPPTCGSGGGGRVGSGGGGGGAGVGGAGVCCSCSCCWLVVQPLLCTRYIVPAVKVVTFYITAALFYYWSYNYVVFFIPFIILALLSPSLPSSNSDPGSHSGPSFPLPTTVRAFIFIARIVKHFVPSSTRVEWYLPTLLGALSS